MKPSDDRLGCNVAQVCPEDCLRGYSGLFPVCRPMCNARMAGRRRVEAGKRRVAGKHGTWQNGLPDRCRTAFCCGWFCLCMLFPALQQAQCVHPQATGKLPRIVAADVRQMHSACTVCLASVYGVGCERARSPLRTRSPSTPYTPNAFGEHQQQLSGGVCLLLEDGRIVLVAMRGKACRGKTNRSRRQFDTCPEGHSATFHVCLPRASFRLLHASCPPCERCTSDGKRETARNILEDNPRDKPGLHYTPIGHQTASRASASLL